MLTRDELADRYLDQMPYPPYPFQEEALLAWFAAEQGVLVCAPTGMGKTLIAEAALFEALHTGTTAYYTTPVIALTEQKFREMQAQAVRWGFEPTDVGLVTGNRRENPSARVLVVVAEILLNRLLHRAAFDFTDVSAVVMDEFHSFSDFERGIVWELTLGLLPKHVRTLLLSATVGNTREFMHWLRMAHQRKVDLVESDQRKVPLTYQWVGDELLVEQIELMADGDEASRKMPALVFCFNREECWNVAEQVKGKRLLMPGQQAQLDRELREYDWSLGAGPKLKQLLLRGVGVHHAGVLPRYRRIVEELFQKKLLSVCACTETLSAGINLPARSVVLPNILKGPPDKQRVIDPSSAHQIFGRAGRPQFDTQGYVYVLAHEDDVKIARWKAKYDQIPEDTKDPNLLKIKKDLKRKAPKRRENQQYWTEAQFDKLRLAKPGRLTSRGHIPWRLLAWLLDITPEVEPIRRMVSRRLMDSAHLEAGQRELDRMLLTLWRAGFVTLEPEPPKDLSLSAEPQTSEKPEKKEPAEAKGSGTSGLLQSWIASQQAAGRSLAGVLPPGVKVAPAAAAEAPRYQAEMARATPELAKLLVFRSVNPLYGVYLVNQLGIADRQELVQAMESVLELPRSIGRYVRVPRYEEMPPGPLASSRLDGELLRLGLATAEELAPSAEPEPDRRHSYDEDKVWIITLAEKLRRLFDYDFPGVHGLFTQGVWAAGEVLEFAGDFNKYITSKGLQKQEGVIFRHLLRLILLLAEFEQLCPPELDPDTWRAELQEIGDRVTECCRKVDPTSTEKALEQVSQDAAEEDEE